jgi:hypothetical protein
VFEEKHSKKVFTINGILNGGSRKIIQWSKTVDQMLEEENPNWSDLPFETIDIMVNKSIRRIANKGMFMTDEEFEEWKKEDKPAPFFFRCSGLQEFFNENKTFKAI